MQNATNYVHGCMAVLWSIGLLLVGMPCIVGGHNGRPAHSQSAHSQPARGRSAGDQSVGDQSVRDQSVCTSSSVQQVNLEQSVQAELCDGAGRVCKVLFSPNGGIQRNIIRLSALEKRQIRFAFYAFTNKKVADELIRAKARGVTIEGVVCGSTLGDANCQVPRLLDAGIRISVYRPRAGERSLMHHKFMLFSDVLGREIVEAGSWNCTHNAEHANREHALFIDNRTLDPHEENLPACYAHEFHNLLADRERVYPLSDQASVVRFSVKDTHHTGGRHVHA